MQVPPPAPTHVQVGRCDRCRERIGYGCARDSARPGIGNDYRVGHRAARHSRGHPVILGHQKIGRGDCPCFISANITLGSGGPCAYPRWSRLFTGAAAHTSPCNIARASIPSAASKQRHGLGRPAIRRERAKVDWGSGSRAAAGRVVGHIIAGRQRGEIVTMITGSTVRKDVVLQCRVPRDVEVGATARAVVMISPRRCC